MRKTVLITGAGSGIGLATAKTFAEHDYHVILAGKTVEKLEKAKNEIGECAVAFLWDITKISQIKSKIQDAISIFGTLDVVVNNAGCLFMTDRTGDFFHVTPEEWDGVHTTNLKAMFFICQAVLEYMVNEGLKGHIVNVCSEMGFRQTYTPYGISKWGVRGLTYGLGRTFAPYGIVVNGVAPGQTATPIVGYQEGDSPAEESIPRGIMATPKEIANLIYFLGSESGNNLMGEIVVSDGGRHLY